MNKKEFLSQLEKKLFVLAKEEIIELVSFYKERIDNGVYEGKTEADVIKELESPDVIAKNIYKEFNINIETINKSKIKKDVVEKSKVELIFTMFGLGFLTLAFIFPILAAMFAVSVSFVTASFGIILFYPLFLIFNQLSVLEFILFTPTGFYLSLLCTILGLLVIEAFIYLLKNVIIIYVKTINNDQLMIARIKRWSLLYNNKKIKKYFTKASRLALYLIAIPILTVPTLFLTEGLITRSIDGVYLHEEVLYEENHIDLESINLDIKGLPISIFNSTDDKVRVVYKTDYDNDIEEKFEFENEELDITLTDEYTWNEIFRIERSKIELHVPVVENLSITSLSGATINLKNRTIKNLELNLRNSKINLENVSYQTLELSTTNSKIELENISIIDKNILSSIVLDTTNGKIDLENVESDIIDISSTNGHIELDNLNEMYKTEDSKLTMKTTNAKLDLEDVYFKTVIGHTTNGNIDFENDDLSYRIYTDFKTTNGRTDIEIG